MLLEESAGGRGELQSSELEAGYRQHRDWYKVEGYNTHPRFSKREMMGPTSPRWRELSVYAHFFKDSSPICLKTLYMV